MATPVLSCQDYGIPNSNTLYLVPTYTSMLDCACILYFFFSRWNRTRWAVKNKFDRNVNIVMIVTFVMMLGDLIYAIISMRRPFYSGLLRPIIVGCFLHSVRINAINLLYDLKDSTVIILGILMFIFVYANIGNFIFRSNIEGYVYFDSL